MDEAMLCFFFSRVGPIMILTKRYIFFPPQLMNFLEWYGFPSLSLEYITSVENAKQIFISQGPPLKIHIIV